MNEKIKTLISKYQHNNTYKGESVQFGINGFGRIGRTLIRNWWSYYRNFLNLVQVNTSGSLDIQGVVHLLKYDTMQGTFQTEVRWLNNKNSQDDDLIGFILIDNRKIKVTSQKQPKLINWDNNIHTIVEATGKFNNIFDASQHLRPNVKRIIISAPAKDQATPTSIVNVLEQKKQRIFSNSSCTTNCIAPIIKIISEFNQIETVSFSTTHAYTDDQNLQDNSHKDLRRARNGALNIIPTSTGASQELEKVFPKLTGKIIGSALRVPVATGSIADINIIVSNPITTAELKDQLIKIIQTKKWKNILSINREPIVSSDIVGRTESAIIDLPFTQANANLIKIMAWYDNETGYCSRILDQIVLTRKLS